MAPRSNWLMHSEHATEIKAKNQYSETLLRGFWRKKERKEKKKKKKKKKKRKKKGFLSEKAS
jgi:hypothetical protein